MRRFFFAAPLNDRFDEKWIDVRRGEKKRIVCAGHAIIGWRSKKGA